MKRATQKKRNTKSRKERPIILIQTEGKNQTEENYFKHFSNSFLKITPIKGNYTDPINMTSQLIKKFKNTYDANYDYAICFVDSDFAELKNKQIKEADTKIKKSKCKNFSLIVSSPCFEIWFLCHYTCSDRKYINNDEVIQHLKEYIPDYEKNSTTFYPKLDNRINLAIKHSKKLEENRLKDGCIPHTVDFQPSTEVYKVFEDIIFKHSKQVL